MIIPHNSPSITFLEYNINESDADKLIGIVSALLK